MGTSFELESRQDKSVIRRNPESGLFRTLYQKQPVRWGENTSLPLILIFNPQRLGGFIPNVFDVIGNVLIGNHSCKLPEFQAKYKVNFAKAPPGPPSLAVNP
jgi:hypothetical protein